MWKYDTTIIILTEQALQVIIVFMQGAKVIIGDLQTSNGDKIAQEIGENAVFVAMDVRILYS